MKHSDGKRTEQTIVFVLYNKTFFSFYNHSCMAKKKRTEAWRAAEEEEHACKRSLLIFIP
jgi:hypothetical protein